MDISPAIFVGSGELTLPLVRMLEERLREMHRQEPWLYLLHGLHLESSGQLLHFPLAPGCRELKDKAVPGLSAGQDMKARFAALMRPASGQPGQEIFLDLFHEVLRTDLAKELSRTGHQLDKDPNVYLVATSFDAQSSATALPLIDALGRLYTTGMIQSRPRVKLFVLLPDLYPELNNTENWARTFEFLRELSALFLDARLTGSSSRGVEADLAVHLFGRGLSNGMAIPSWESYVAPMAEFISLEARNLLKIKQADLAFLDGKPAFMNAFGYFRFFYPGGEVDGYLKELVRYYYGRRFVDDSGKLSEDDLIKDLVEWGRDAGFSDRGVQKELLAEAGLSEREPYSLPVLTSGQVAGAGVAEVRARLSHALDSALERYTGIKENKLADEEGALKEAYSRLVEKKIEDFDLMVKKHFLHPLSQDKSRVSLEHGPRLLRLLLNLPVAGGRSPDAPNPAGPGLEGPIELSPHVIDAWEREWLEEREELMGAQSKSHEMHAAETVLRDSINAVASLRGRIEQIAEKKSHAEKERLEKLAELDGKMAELSERLEKLAPKPKPKPAEKPAAVEESPVTGSEPKTVREVTESSGSIADRLWKRASEEKKQVSSDSLVGKLWGDGSASAPKPHTLQKPEQKKQEQSGQNFSAEESPADDAGKEPSTQQSQTGSDSAASKPQGEAEPENEAVSSVKALEREMEEIKRLQDQYYSRPSPREQELASQQSAAQAQLERMEKEIPQMESRLDRIRQDLQVYREKILDESLERQRMLELEDKLGEKARKVQAQIVDHLSVDGAAKPKKKGQSGIFRALIELVVLPAVVLTLVGLTYQSFSSSSTAIVALVVGLVAGLVLWIYRGYRIVSQGRQADAATEQAPSGASRLAERVNKLTSGYKLLLDTRHRLVVNRLCLTLLSRLRWRAASMLTNLEDFKTEMHVDAPEPPMLQVDESPWEISLAPPDVADYFDREYGESLSKKLTERTEADRLWSFFKSYERSHQAPPVDEDILEMRDSTYQHEREEMELADRLIDRLKSESFRAFFYRLITNLGVAATINEETSCESDVRKNTYLALKAPEKTFTELIDSIRDATGLDLIRIDSDDPHSMALLVHWRNWAPFQLTQAVKARQSRNRLVENKADKSKYSVIPEAAYPKLPSIFPVRELLNVEQLDKRELALASVAMGWIVADWDKTTFTLSDEMKGSLSMPDRFGYNDFVLYLASAGAAEVANALASRFKRFIYEGDGPEDDRVRTAALARIDAMCRQYEDRGALFHSLEDEDYEILRTLPEKLIKV